MSERETPPSSTREATGPGHVTFFQEPPRRDRLIVVLLAMITGLLSLLVVGLAAGAIWVAGEYNRLDAALTTGGQSIRAQLAQTQAATGALLDQVNARQVDMTNRLVQEQEALSAELAELDRQRQALGTDIPADPFAKADYAIRISQLTLRQLALTNRYWDSIHETVTRTATPLPGLTGVADAVEGR